MYNAYEQEPNGIASGKKYDYCEYRRGHESGKPKVKTDFLLPVLKVQIILCIAIGIFMIIIHFLRREMLDFTAFPVFFVSNLLLVQRKKYYFNRATVSRNCSIVL